MPALPEQPAVRTSFVGDGPARLYVRELGRGLPIVVLHGGPDFDHEYLLPDLDRLAGRFHLVYYDQRGRGRSFSGQPPDGVTIATEMEDVDRVRDWTSHASIALLGHSWGGLLALEYAIRHPDRVSHLILVNTAPASHASMLVLRHKLVASRSPQQAARMAELLADPAYRAGDIEADAEYYRIHFGSALRRPDQLDHVIRQLRVGFTSEGIVAARLIEDDLYAQTWSVADYNLIPELRRLRIPTLVIHGERDLVPVDVALEIASAISGSHLIVLNDCGHFAYLEQPDSVLSAITELMAPRQKPVRS
jgi:proline iminopeptidase